MPRRFMSVTAMIAALVLLGTAEVAAKAPEPSVQEKINAHLAAYPEGKQTSPTELTYGDGAFVITFERPANSINGPDCPSNMFCFYDRVNYGYPRGRLSDCGWQDLANWGWQNLTDSVHYNQSYGSVVFINHSSRADHGADYGLFTISASNRYDNDVHPYRNMADHVLRYC